MSQELSILNETKCRLPSLPFLHMKNTILGKKYFLSVAFVSPKKSQKLNFVYRKKNKPTNILSFALSKNSGELILCPSVIKKESPNFERSYQKFLGLLVIHGMLHLKGMTHGSIMEIEEQKYDEIYFSGNRRRYLHDKSSSGRIRKGRKKS